jgi:hypothetical protein
MKITPTAAQEISLRKLFDGNHIEREQVISLHRPEMQEKMRNLIKAKQNSDKLLPILFADLGYASGEMRKNPENQFWRRTTIRALAAAVDGIIYCLKQTALFAGKMSEYKFNDEELFLLSEEPVESESGKKMRRPVFRENIKYMFKLFYKVHRISCPTDFGHSGFNALCETYELRHRLMHPKSFFTFCVNDDEKLKAGEAVAWLNEEIKKLLDACGNNIGNF